MGGSGAVEEVSAVYLVRGREYQVSLSIQPDTNLTVGLEDRASGDEWRADFPRTVIEEMTHKTGNFKRFAVFAAMLRTVLTQPTDSLALDLMTYADLEQLRQSKAGVLQQQSQPRAGSGGAARANKRYLILSYTAAFDKIHYPMPLLYQGQADPQQLKESLRRARTELKSLRDRGVGNALSEEVEDLRAENRRLVAENRRLRETAGKPDAPKETALRKELAALKALVRNLEEDLSNERTKEQRTNLRKGRDSRKLSIELEEVRASERALKARVRNLTQELAFFRRPQHRLPSPRLPPVSGSGLTPVSARGRLRSRSAGSDAAGSRHSSREGSVRSAEGGGRRFSRERSLSPAVRPRFDPTAWVREQQRRKDEQRRGTSRHWSPASSVRSAPVNAGADSPRDRRRHPSSSGSECGSSASRTRPPVRLEDEERKTRQRQSRAPLSDLVQNKPRGRRRQKYTTDADAGDGDYRVQAAEISEIDERLNRLQDFLRRNLPTAAS